MNTNAAVRLEEFPPARNAVTPSRPLSLPRIPEELAWVAGVPFPAWSWVDRSAAPVNGLACALASEGGWSPPAPSARPWAGGVWTRVGPRPLPYPLFLATSPDVVLESRVAWLASARKLTGRQRTVLRLLCDGLTNAEIAAELGACTSTVEAHVHAVFDRVGAESRARLLALVWSWDAIAWGHHAA
jgi:DNA-binding CsgD family transcriptional regulator